MTNADDKPLAHGVSRLRFRYAIALCLTCGISSPTARVLAGPVEQLVGLVLGPADSPVMVARYEQGGGGLLLSRDRGRSWKLQCSSAYLAPGASAGPLQVL